MQHKLNQLWAGRTVKDIMDKLNLLKTSLPQLDENLIF